MLRLKVPHPQNVLATDPGNAYTHIIDFAGPLIVVDKYSKWAEVVEMHSTTEISHSPYAYQVSCFYREPLIKMGFRVYTGKAQAW